jgi:hypothetical protein
MHLSILAIILFGLPSLTFVFPKFNLSEKPVRVVVMTKQEADKISQKPPPVLNKSKAKTTEEKKKQKKQRKEIRSRQQ